jgi:rhodanese-related sulfurtransferase
MYDVFPNELSLWQRRSALLLDERSPEEFASGHIPGSRNLPLEQLLEALHTLKSPIVIICATSSRAGLAAEVLGYQGFEVGKLVGGLRYPLERSTPNAATPFKPEEAPCS